MRGIYQFWLAIGFGGIGTWVVQAQKTSVFTEPQAAYYKALEYYRSQRYASAYGELTQWLTLRLNQTPEYSQALFYRAAAAFHLDYADAYPLLQQFMADYPSHPLRHRAAFLSGLWQFRISQWARAIAHWEEVDSRQLTAEEVAEMRFKRGYSHFQLEQFDKALADFDALVAQNGPYATDARYYRGHIHFEKGRLEAALRDFKDLEYKTPYNKTAPYYIAQIYYLRREYDKAGSYARQVADTAKGKYLTQMLKIWAESDFRTRQYRRCTDAYRRLEEMGGLQDLAMKYRYGIALLQSERYDEASRLLGEVAGGEDSLAQNAAYHLARALMLGGRKKEALQAFKTAWRLSHDRNLAEDALFNFAKLAYELDYDPYHEAIRALNSYLEAYPNSPRNDELYTFLSEIYMGTRNYQEALEALEKIKNKTRRIREAYQRIAYLKAVELFNADRFEDAVRFFNLSSRYPESLQLAAEAIFWTGEAFYRMGKEREAAEAYEEFRLMPASRSSPLYPLVLYNLAYIQFRKENYREASVLFRQFLEEDQGKSGRRYTDVLLRVADCYYALRDFEEALRYYDKALESGVKFEQDYALLQKGVVLGIMNRPREKAAVLDQLIAQHPRSVYLAEALYDAGSTRMRLGETNAAEVLLERVVKEFPQSRLRPRALLKLGLLAYNRNENVSALSYYKAVLENYPGTAEATEALRYVRNIYVEEGRLEDFQAFLARLKGVTLSESALDSATYYSAENRLLKGDCQGAIEGFTKYISTYPRGPFLTAARYFRGDCLARTGRTAEALEDFEYVAFAESNPFTENALFTAASIALQQNNCLRAVPFLEKLAKVAELSENRYYAQRHLMACAFQAGDYARAAQFARPVLESEKTPQADEELGWMALGYEALQKGDTSEAEKFFQKTADRPASYYGPEAKYQLCRLLFLRRDYERCEKKILDWANSLSHQRHWLARLYILLGQTYVALGNSFQARATLQSIVDNHDGPEEVAEARRLLEELNRSEPPLPQAPNISDE
ncbi:MAG: tetratricopeptide repeat protein [Flavobacteriales bacterium]|nr:tetratricopeptide repeat protein [Flavobacteriales bacterium]